VTAHAVEASTEESGVNTADQASEYALELRGITKRFGAVVANRDIDLSVRRGCIHGIVGENGAGKSTLMSILYGFYQADEGEILIRGESASILSSRDAIDAGIGMVHQHFMLVDTFSVLENVVLGAETHRLLKPNTRNARAELSRLAEEFGLGIDVDAIAGKLPVGEQQRTVILITHKLREIIDITDEVSVLRLGQMVAHRHTADTSMQELAELMVGRSLVETDYSRDEALTADAPIAIDVHGLELKAASGAMRLNGVDLQVRRGEILGVAGVAGNGQSALLEVLSGMLAPTGGRFVRFNWRGFLRLDVVRDLCASLMRGFDVRPVNPKLRSASFSGGNQQKLILARELDKSPDVLLVGQPTRGVDIGAIELIHERLVEMRDGGCAILLVSVELDEIMALSDRIVVMYEGKIVGEVSKADADKATLGLMMANAHPGALMALFFAGLIMLAIGVDPIEALGLMIRGALGDDYALGYTLYYTTNFIFTGLAVAVAFHASLFNIGGEGQAYIGGLGVAVVFLLLDRFLPAILLIPIGIAAAGLFGAAWAFIPAWLQAYRGSHIVITTIMFNFIAASLMVYLLVNVLIQPGQMSPESRQFDSSGWMPSMKGCPLRWYTPARCDHQRHVSVRCIGRFCCCKRDHGCAPPLAAQLYGGLRFYGHRCGIDGTQSPGGYCHGQPAVWCALSRRGRARF